MNNSNLKLFVRSCMHLYIHVYILSAMPTCDTSMQRVRYILMLHKVHKPPTRLKLQHNLNQNIYPVTGHSILVQTILLGL